MSIALESISLILIVTFLLTLELLLKPVIAVLLTNLGGRPLKCFQKDANQLLLFIGCSSLGFLP
jgi:hypothetical protein